MTATQTTTKTNAEVGRYFWMRETSRTAQRDALVVSAAWAWRACETLRVRVVTNIVKLPEHREISNRIPT